MLARAARLYGDSFLRCLPLALLGAVLAAAVGSYASTRTSALVRHLLDVTNEAVSSPDNAFAALDDVAVQATAALHSLGQSPSIWLSMLGALLVGLGFHGAVIARQSAGLRWAVGGTGDAAGSAPGWLSLTLRRLPSLLLAVAILTLAAACAAVLMVIGGALGVGVAVCVDLLVLAAGSWLWGRLQLWLVAMFAANLGAIAALQASWRLVRHHWWRVSTMITVAYLAAFVVAALGGLIAGAGGGGGAATRWLARLLPLLSAALALPVLPAVWLELYRELRESPRAPQLRTPGALRPDQMA